MAKKKDEIIEEVLQEEVKVDEPVDEVEEFISRSLIAINSMKNKAKAKRCAERVLANRRKGNR